MEKLVKRSGKVAFMDISTTQIPNFLRMRKFTEISKSKNPTEYSRTYVDEDGEITDVTGYSEEISYAFDLYSGNLVHEKIVKITDDELTGDEALVNILIVDFSKPSGDGYEARLRTYTTVPDTEGDATEAYTYSGTFRKNSKMSKGIATLNADNTVATFTETEVVAEYPVTFLVKDTDGPVADASIKIEGTTYLTDATGIAVVFLDAEEHTNIEVSKSGYTTQSTVSVTVTNKAELKEITLVEA